ncbi:MAG: Helix-turn-helix protein [Chloroflexi bacterium]|nr:Helix-turn-helix protein [Chloroflexota bacterium]
MVRGTRRGERAYRELAEEFRHGRLAAGWSQDRVAALIGVSRSHYIEIEAARATNLSIVQAARIAAVLGLDLSVRAYPGSGPLRDAAHTARLESVLRRAMPPLRVQREVPLPSTSERSEQRAWDAVVLGHGRRTAIELEMRITDAQAVERRLQLKRRDDPPDRFILLVAETKSNRRLLAANATLFSDLPRRGLRAVIAVLEAGEHPASCLVVL